MKKNIFDVENAFKKLNLQLFAEGGDGGDGGEGGNQEPNPTPNPKDDKKYSDDDVDKIIAKKMAEWEKKQKANKAKEDEASRLANLTEKEKEDKRLKELEERISNYEKREKMSAMAKVARDILSDSNITINDDLLSNLINEDAEKTKSNIESFIKLFNDAVQKEVASKLKQDPPRKGPSSAGKITKEDIMKVKNARERQRLISENMDLFK